MQSATDKSSRMRIILGNRSVSLIPYASMSTSISHRKLQQCGLGLASPEGMISAARTVTMNELSI
jgi:hypothetical protein